MLPRILLILVAFVCLATVHEAVAAAPRCGRSSCTTAGCAARATPVARGPVRRLFAARPLRQLFAAHPLRKAWRWLLRR